MSMMCSSKDFWFVAVGCINYIDFQLNDPFYSCGRTMEVTFQDCFCTWLHEIKKNLTQMMTVISWQVIMFLNLMESSTSFVMSPMLVILEGPAHPFSSGRLHPPKSCWLLPKTTATQTYWSSPPRLACWRYGARDDNVFFHNHTIKRKLNFI